jgi:sn-glycerol 3-phosphate transport system substrate-binding protein
MKRRTLLAATLAAPLAAPAVVRAQATTEISFLFPVAVGGPITKIIDGYARDFEAETPGVRVKPIYAGSYVDTLTKAQASLKAGDGPTMAVLLAVDAHSLIDGDLVVPFDSVADTDADRAWLGSFYPAFLANGRIGGHTWGIPFQRSTIVLFWNKPMLEQAGFSQAPQTWAEHATIAAKLSQKDQRWGTLIPGTGFTYWLFQALVTQAGGELANADGTQVAFDSAASNTALKYWLDLQGSGATPPGLVEWGTTPRDFLEGRAGMIWTTTGNLSNIKANAKFPFGVSMLPAGAQRGSPTGGGNFHLFAAANPAQRQAALKFLRWVTSPDRAAQWGIDTGYVAVRPDAWETPRMKAYVAGFPEAAVARDQLRYAVPELSTHDNQRVTQALNDGLQAALTGRKPAGPALADAQSAATRLLRTYQ